MSQQFTEEQLQQIQQARLAVRAELDADINEKDIKYRPKDNRLSAEEFKQLSRKEQRELGLSYFETWQVIDRLNQILGTENWSHQVLQITKLEAEKPTYMAHVRLTVNVGGVVTVKDGIGYGTDKGKYNPHEMAIKEAESDALKRAAKNLGRSVGLALYDKSQEYVSDEDSSKTTTANLQDASKSDSARNPKDRIKQAYAELLANGKTTKSDFSAKYLNGGKVADLSNTDTLLTLRKLSQDFPELNLV